MHLVCILLEIIGESLFVSKQSVPAASLLQKPIIIRTEAVSTLLEKLLSYLFYI